MEHPGTELVSLACNLLDLDFSDDFFRPSYASGTRRGVLLKPPKIWSQVSYVPMRVREGAALPITMMEIFVSVLN